MRCELQAKSMIGMLGWVEVRRSPAAQLKTVRPIMRGDARLKLSHYYSDALEANMTAESL
jgi:hypothetical protein